METTGKGIKRRHDETFKKAAVELLMSSGKPAKQIAEELGVSTGTCVTGKSVTSPQWRVRLAAWSSWRLRIVRCARSCSGSRTSGTY